MKTKPILTNYFKSITNVASQGDAWQVTAIQRTIALQEEIDALYPEAESRIVGNGRVNKQDRD